MFNVHLTILYNNGCDFTINSYMVNVEKKAKKTGSCSHKLGKT